MTKCLLSRIILSLALLLVSQTVCMGMFHSGGVGSCSGCHILHESADGGPLPGEVSPHLLASDPSSVCLNCHAGPGGPDSPSIFSFDGSALTPGGDFYWLTKTFTWSGGSSAAATHGHNIVASDFNLVADPQHIKSPGGTFPAFRLSCTSCHDPHGRTAGGTFANAPPVSISGSYGFTPVPATSTGTYRMLAGAGYSTDGYTFNFDAPTARQNPLAPFAESDTTHVDYGKGMSEWCANCHVTLLASDHVIEADTFAHPSGNAAFLEQEIADHYNQYVKSNDMSGTAATAYLQFVPFERGVSDPALLDPISTMGPNEPANVSCLTCHRAHASAFPSAGRWDFSAEQLINSHPATGDTGATPDDIRYSYYGRDLSAEFGPGQGNFCEKCHGEEAP